MALQHHYVVVVEDGKMWIDWDVSINFDSGSVWDTEQETWLTIDELSPEDYQKWDDTSELLASVLELHNDPRL